MDKIAVLIPCYNEGKTITKVVTDFRQALPEATVLQSIAFFIPIMVIYITTGLVPRIPTLVVCMFGMTAAIQAFFLRPDHADDLYDKPAGF